MDKIPIGYTAIAAQLGLQTLRSYRESYIATHGRGKTIIDNHHEIHIYPKTYALPKENDLIAHLEFALKYEGINLPIIKGLFEHSDKNKITQYVQNQSTGVYARKIWFLYEFLMDDLLDLPDCKRLKYVDLLDPKIYFTGDKIKSSRHAINDNLLGNKYFCPFVRHTELIEKYIELNFDNKAKTLLKKYDPYLIGRACNYLYSKETMSTYKIEKENPDKNRTARFITLLQQASTIESLSKEDLIELQNSIVDPRFKDVNYRTTQNYVGENVNPYFQKIHYISPKPEDVSELMVGLLSSLDRMLNANVHPVIIATVISFGFVFIHPFEDGNGRIHRFLIHYILSKTGFTPKDMIFPLSAIMLQKLYDYDAILESYSKPLLSVLTNYDLSDEGVLKVNQESKSHYQSIDFTLMTEYIFECIEEAIDHYIEQEIQFLIHYDEAKKAIQNIVDMPDKNIDLFIKLVMQNQGKLSQPKRERFFRLLTDAEIEELTTIVNSIMIAGDNED